MASLKEYRLEQLDKLKQLKALGIDPYPALATKDLSFSYVLENFKQLLGQTKWLAGRLLNIREHGQITFLDVADQDAGLQLIVKAPALKEAQSSLNQLRYQDLHLLTRGDFINAKGIIAFSQKGEMSLEVLELKILTKVLRPLPKVLEDVQTRRRQRYLDLAINPDVRQRFVRRTRFWQSVRDFLNQREFLEINTPVLEHTTGGAEALPFKTHMRALDEDFYLRISHELPLKKLLGGGYEKIYDIGPRFRNENYSDEHLPEHIAMEWYWAYANWEDGMKLMEEMFAWISLKTFGRQKFNFLDKTVDFNQAWPRLDYQQVIADHYQIDVFKTNIKQVNQVLQKHDLEVEKNHHLAAGVDKLFKNIRQNLAGPFWLINLPTYMSPLSKQDPKNPKITQRFQGIVGGSEICNGFSELNNPLDQLQRFKEQQALRQDGNEEAQMMDLDFVEMLEYGMPPACGLGFSERVFWILEGVVAREGVPFNHLCFGISPQAKEIYKDILS